MAAALLWARSSMRSHWRSAALVVLIAGLCSGATMAAIAGARRTTTSFTRFVRDSLEPQVFVASPDAETAAVAASLMRQATDPQRVGQAVVLAAAPAAADPGQQIEIAVIGAIDDAIGRTLWLPKIVSGERAGGPDSVNVNEVVADALGLHTGDRMAMVGYSPKAYEDCAAGGRACAPDVDLGEVTISGIVRRPDDISPDSFGAMTIELAPELTARWSTLLAPNIWITGAWVDNEVDRDALGAAITAAIGPERVEGDNADVFLETDSNGDPERTSGALDVEHNGLLIIAALAAISGLIAVPQSLARLESSAGSDHQRMRALGATRRDRLVAVSLVSLIIGAVSAIAAVAVAVAASPLLPIGLARRAEPSLGVHADSFVLGLGAAMTVVMVTGAGVVVGLLVRGRPATAGTSRLSRLFAASRPVPGIAWRFLFDGGRASPVARTAFTSGVIGVAVIAGGAIILRSQDVLVTRPALFGAPWDLQGGLANGDPAALDAVRADPRVDAAAILRAGRIDIRDHQIGLVAMEPVRGTLEPTLLDGRMIRGDGEIVLSPSMMDELQLRLGDPVQVGPADDRAPLTVVGRGVPVAVGIYSSEDGALVSAADFERFAFQNDIEGEGGVDLAVRGMSGTDLASLRADLAVVTGGFDRAIADAFQPARISNIERVRSVPKMVMAFAALLTSLVLVHALTVVAQRRRPDLAVLRALGMPRRQACRVMAWHGVILAGVAVAIGVPLGIIGGRLLWRAIAAAVSAVYSPHLPVLGLTTLVVAVLTGALVAGSALGRSAVPRALAPWLRSE